MQEGAKTKMIVGVPSQAGVIYMVYVIESAAYGVVCTSCLCQKPERARYERVRAFDTTTSAYNPVQSTFYDVSCLLHVTREFSLK